MNNEFETVPNHIAIIMDGNGRWAKKRFLPRVAGHRKGVQSIKKITVRASELGVKLITVYAFSTENWGRPQEEVNFLMKLPKEFFNEFLPQLIENNIRIEVIGHTEKLPKATQEILNSAIDKTSHCTGMVLNFALNYGSRQEITDAVKDIITDIKNNKIEEKEVTESLINKYLMTGRYNEFSDPDLIIRTSGEERLSNFLLWQAAYSEFYFTDILWPDFDERELDKAIIAYNGRQRRFGKLKDNQSS